MMQEEAEIPLNGSASQFPVGVVLSGGTTPTGSILTAVAEHLARRGHHLAGVVRSDPSVSDDEPCGMTLTVLGNGNRVDIAQDLGRQSDSCRLDHVALEDAVGLVDRWLGPATELLIVNKFGKREGEGAGFRQTIARALENGIPVLLGAGEGVRPALEAFLGGTFDTLPEDVDAILAWCEGVMRHHPADPAR